jgi:hypothetical protein
VKERGIIFQGWGVRAIRNMKPGVWPAEAIDPALPIKWQTRRVVKWKPYEPTTNLRFGGLTLGHYCTGVPESGWVLRSRGGNSCWNDRTHPAHCPYGVPGDGLYVRETWACRGKHTDSQPICDITRNRAHFEIWYSSTCHGDDGKPLFNLDHLGKWRPSIHMPRWASREDLVVKEVRVERVTWRSARFGAFGSRSTPSEASAGTPTRASGWSRT